MTRGGSLRRFWIRFDLSSSPDLPVGLRPGCGVTAFDRNDALELVRQNVFRDESLPSIVSVLEDIDVRDLDQDHIVPNMGVVAFRGVWYPKGYEA